MNGVRDLPPGLRNLDYPPTPPDGLFFARFKSGRFIERVTGKPDFTKIPILVKNAVYPITFSWSIRPENAINYRVAEKKTATLTGTGSLLMTSLRSDILNRTI